MDEPPQVTRRLYFFAFAFPLSLVALKFLLRLPCVEAFALALFGANDLD
jgi:hypothetical protein